MFYSQAFKPYAVFESTVYSSVCSNSFIFAAHHMARMATEKTDRLHTQNTEVLYAQPGQHNNEQQSWDQ